MKKTWQLNACNTSKSGEGSLNDFLQKAEGQVKGIDESIAFTNQQIQDEENSFASLTEQLSQMRSEVELKREYWMKAFDAE